MDMNFKDQQDQHYDFTGEVPKEIMDQFQQLLGNAMARVSVSADMGIKTFGTGGGAMVTISLSCNQDAATIQAAAQLATQTALYYAAQNRAAAEAEVVRVVEERKRTGTGPNFA